MRPWREGLRRKTKTRLLLALRGLFLRGGWWDGSMATEVGGGTGVWRREPGGIRG